MQAYENEDDPLYDINFSTELNKTSLKNINRKNISILCNTSRVPSHDVHRVSSLMNELIKAEKYDLARSIAESYSDDPVRFVETIIKVNKCNPSVTSLGTKAKKLLTVSSS
eukprot:37830-Eustigmatos_ZCMA.PRE.1